MPNAGQTLQVQQDDKQLQQRREEVSGRNALEQVMLGIQQQMATFQQESNKRDQEFRTQMQGEKTKDRESNEKQSAAALQLEQEKLKTSNAAIIRDIDPELAVDYLVRGQQAIIDKQMQKQQAAAKSKSQAQADAQTFLAKGKAREADKRLREGGFTQPEVDEFFKQGKPAAVVAPVKTPPPTLPVPGQMKGPFVDMTYDAQGKPKVLSVSETPPKNVLQSLLEQISQLGAFGY